MKTKFILALLMSGVLLLTTACSTAANAANAKTATQETAISTASASMSAAAAAEASQKEAPPAKMDDQSMITGKITAVSGDTITLAQAVTREPDNRGEKPDGVAPPADGSAPERPSGAPPTDGSVPERPARDNSEAPSGAEPPSGTPGGGRGQGREMNMEFSDEAVTYSIAGFAVITKGMGDNAETITLDDLAAGDMIRIELNDNGQITAIRLMDMDGDGQPPQMSERDSSSVK